MTVRKLRMLDVDELRQELDELYEQTTQIVLNRWALLIAERMLLMIGMTSKDLPELEAGFEICRSWREGQVRVHDIRQAGFAVHRLAKSEQNQVHQAVFRTVGQAIGSGHMREHAMVASDYAIKATQLFYPHQLDKISEERLWQLACLKQLRTEAE